MTDDVNNERERFYNALRDLQTLGARLSQTSNSCFDLGFDKLGYALRRAWQETIRLEKEFQEYDHANVTRMVKTADANSQSLLKTALAVASMQNQLGDTD